MSLLMLPVTFAAQRGSLAIYIHERDGWPQFEWNSQDVNTQLAALRFRQGRRSGRMEVLGSALREEAVLHILSEDVVAAAEMDRCNAFDRHAVRAGLALRMREGSGLPLPAEARYTGALDIVIDTARNSSTPVTLERLLSWHAGLLADETGAGKKRIGGLRRGGAVRTGLESVERDRRRRLHLDKPDAAQLAAEHAAFLDWVNADASVDLVLKAAIAHLWFLVLQPFERNNGRIAQALTDMLLARSEDGHGRFYSLSAQLLHERRAYAFALDRARRGSLDITAWLQWFLGCLDRAVASTDELLAPVLRKAHFWELLANESLSERQRAVLGFLLDDSRAVLTASAWAARAETSKDTALRDIRELLGRGLLVKDDAGGRSSGYRLAVPKLG